MKNEVTNEEIVDFFNGKDVSEADAILLKTAENNFKQGYQKRQEEILELIDKLYAKEYAGRETNDYFYYLEKNLEKLKKAIMQSKK